MDAPGGMMPGVGIRPIRIEDCERGIPSVFEEVVRVLPNGMALRTPELRPLAQALAGEFNCLGLELPPAGDCGETMEELAAHYAGIIASQKPVRPIEFTHR